MAGDALEEGVQPREKAKRISSAGH